MRPETACCDRLMEAAVWAVARWADTYLLPIAPVSPAMGRAFGAGPHNAPNVLQVLTLVAVTLLGGPEWGRGGGPAQGGHPEAAGRPGQAAHRVHAPGTGRRLAAAGRYGRRSATSPLGKVMQCLRDQLGRPGGLQEPNRPQRPCFC